MHDGLVLLVDIGDLGGEENEPGPEDQAPDAQNTAMVEDLSAETLRLMVVDLLRAIRHMREC